MTSSPRAATQRFGLQAAAALCIVYPAFTAAQTLEDVVVSASRTEQRSFDAPAAIQSIDRETIEVSGPQVNLSEALIRVPGVTILNRQNYAQDLQLSIRGFGARTAFGIRGVRLIVDGIPASMPDGQGQASTISLTSTERIEVLRGPLAQLYGNASGGVIQAFTRAAPDTPEVSIHGYTGSNDTTRSVFQSAGRVGQYGLVADYGEFQTDGYRQNSQTVRRHFNGKLDWESGRTKFHVVANIFDMPLAQDPGGLGATWSTDPTAAATNFIRDRVRKTVQQNQLGAVLQHRSDGGFSTLARVYGGQREVFQSQSILGQSRWIGVDRDYWGLGLQFSQQFNLRSTPVKVSYGADYDVADEYRSGGNAALGEIVDFTRRQQDYLYYNGDFFAQAELFLTDATTLIGGARRSNVTLDVTDRINAGSSGKTKYSATNPVLGIAHSLSDRLNVYANTGRGFESPSIAETSYSGLVPAATFNAALRAATSRHYELGLKYRPTKASIFDMALYRIDTDNEIVTLVSVGGNTSYINSAKTRREGLEIYYATLLSQRVRLQAAGNYISAAYSDAFQSGADTINDGRKIPGIPQHFVFAELAWNSIGFADQSRSRNRPKGLTLSAEMVSSGKLYANDLNTRVADGYDIANLRAAYAWPIGRGRLLADLRVNNIFDKKYVGSVIVASATPYEPAPDRNWMAGLRYALSF